MRDDAAVWASCGAGSATDPATLQRVAAALRADLDGALLVLSVAEAPNRPGDALPRRTPTPPCPARRDGWPI